MPSTYSSQVCHADVLCSYPGIYIFCFLPNTISRWLTFTNHSPPNAFILFANTIFAFSGFFNFIVFFLTRRAMVVGAQVTGPDGGELLPVNPPASGFLPPGFPGTYESEPPYLPAFDRSSLQNHISPSHTGQFGSSRSAFPTFDKQSSLHSHISPSHTGQFGSPRSTTFDNRQFSLPVQNQYGTRSTTFDNKPSLASLQSHSSPSYTGQYRTSQSQQDEEGHGFLP